MGLWLNLKIKATELTEGGLRPGKSNILRDPDGGGEIAAGLHCNFGSLSADKTLSAVAEVIGQGRIRIIVRGLSPEARNSVVTVVVRSKTNPAAVWLKKQITLNLNDGWVGDWRGPIGNGKLEFRPADAALVVMPVKRMAGAQHWGSTAG